MYIYILSQIIIIAEKIFQTQYTKKFLATKSIAITQVAITN